jgi:hypothetical protein
MACQRWRQAFFKADKKVVLRSAGARTSLGSGKLELQRYWRDSVCLSRSDIPTVQMVDKTRLSVQGTHKHEHAERTDREIVLPPKTHRLTGVEHGRS